MADAEIVIDEPESEPVGVRFAADAEAEPADAESAPVGGRFAADTAVEPADADSVPVGARSAGDTAVELAGADSRAERAPTSTNNAVDVILDESWIAARDPEHYTIQVMALKDRQKLESIVRDRDDLAPWAIYTASGSRGTVHVLVQGDYPDVDSARAARDSFPARIQKPDNLWIRRFAMVQALLEP